MPEIYKKIRELRIKNGMSQQELAEKMGYTDRSAITKIESGAVDLTEPKILKFAEVLGVSPMFLMGWETDQENGQQPYYYNDETAAIAQELHDNPDMHLVFDALRGAGPEDLQKIAEMIKVMRK